MNLYPNYHAGLSKVNRQARGGESPQIIWVQHDAGPNGSPFVKGVGRILLLDNRLSVALPDVNLKVSDIESRNRRVERGTNSG